MKKIKTFQAAPGPSPNKGAQIRGLASLGVTALLFSGLAFSGTADAAVLAQYTFGTGNTASASPTTTGTGFTAGNVVVGAGLPAGGSQFDTNLGNPTPALTAQIANTTSTLSDAFTGQDYFSFTIAPTAYSKVSLSSFTFDALTLGPNGTNGNFTGHYVVESSIAGFGGTSANNLVEFTQASKSNGPGAFETTTLNLGASYQNLLTPVEFRIYLFDDSNATNANRALKVDNVTFNGVTQVVATPEPETWAMMGLGLTALCFMGWKRRKQGAEQAPVATGLAA